MVDLQLMQQIAEGNEKALQELYLLYKDKVYNTALGYLQNREEAEEIAQDVWVSVYRSASQFKGNSAVSTWIYRICINKCLDRLAYLKRRRWINWAGLSEDTVDMPDFDHPGILLEHQENARYLFKAIKELAVSQQTAFVLTYVEGLPQKEVAAIMELSLKAVESLIQRAKQNLRKKLEKYYPGRRK